MLYYAAFVKNYKRAAPEIAKRIISIKKIMTPAALPLPSD